MSNYLADKADVSGRKRVREGLGEGGGDGKSKAPLGGTASARSSIGTSTRVVSANCLAFLANIIGRFWYISI